jgi:hypothetical protein
MPKRTGHSLYCNDALWEQLCLVAKATEHSAAWAIHKAVEEYVAKNLPPVVEEKDE